METAVKQWFNSNQRILVGMANTDYGRDVLRIDKSLPRVVRVGPSFVETYAGVENGKHIFISDFRTAPQIARAVRQRWGHFQSYARYFVNKNYDVPLSDLVRYSRSVLATTTTAFPDPNPESTTVDGHIISLSSSFATARSAATGTSVNDSATIIDLFRVEHDGADYQIFHSMFLFDTSGITDTDVISAATFSGYVTSVNSGDNDAHHYGTLVAATPASNTALAVEDFDQFGTTKFCSDVTIAGTSTGAYKDISLNAAGIAAVSTTGITKFCGREGHDYDNDVIASSANNQMRISSADEALTTQDPKLVVTHAAPPGPAASRRIVICS